MDSLKLILEGMVDGIIEDPGWNHDGAYDKWLEKNAELIRELLKTEFAFNKSNRKETT